jgi:molecular chaperone GrpE
MVPRKEHPDDRAGAPPPAPKAETPAEPGAAPQAPAPPQCEAASLAEEAEDFCASLERFFRRALKELPSTSDLAELHAQQDTARDLLGRAVADGAEARKALAACGAESAKQKEALARSRADFLNYQTRAQNDLRRAEESALRGYMADLLPILDSFDLAVADAHSEQADLVRVRTALEMIRQALDQALKVRGLERIDVAGKSYDTAVHEAVSMRPADAAKGEQPNQVAEQLRPGYLWKGLLLRPAQVLITAPPERKKKE